MDSLGEISLPMMAMTGCATAVLASALAYAVIRSSNSQGSRKTGSTVEQEKIDREKYPGGQITVYFATQTGTAESFARQLEREGPEHGFFVHVVDFEDIEVDQLVDESRKDDGIAKAIVLSATHGEGEPTDNAVIFVQNLAERAATEMNHDPEAEKYKDVPEIFLDSLEYCVFGLGNRQYDHFNALGKFFDHAFERAGGKRLLEIGLGDDEDDLERDFEVWKEQMWECMKKKYVPEDAVLVKQHDSVVIESKYVVEFHDKNAKPKNFKLEDVQSSNRHYFTAVDCPVTVVKELRSPTDPGSTVHMEIDISKAQGLKYQTADNLGVLPLNDSAIVESVANLLGFDLDAVFSLKAAPGHEWQGAPFPMPLSVRECLTRYCDLTQAPRRSDLKLLAEYAKDPTDRKALQRMASKDGRAEYREKILDQYLGLESILKLCPSIGMSLDHFLSYCPMLQTRYFTISSSSSVHPKSIHVSVAVTKETRKDGSLFKGVCSNHLAETQPGKGTIRVFCRNSSFRLPEDASRPILMIGPGTGIAPMRAFLQERLHQRDQRKLNVGTNTLYFGCKKSTQDFLYEDELKNFQNCGILNKLRLAFSREQSHKVYVQDLLREDADEIWNLIGEQNAYIYVCGAVKMGNDVAEVLKEIVSTHRKVSIDEAKHFLDQLGKEGRYVQELWHS